MPNIEQPLSNSNNSPNKVDQPLSFRERGKKTNDATLIQEMLEQENALEKEIAENEKYLQSLLAEREKRFPDVKQAHDQAYDKAYEQAYSQAHGKAYEQAYSRAHDKALKQAPGNLPPGWADLPKMSSDKVRTVEQVGKKAKSNSSFRRAVDKIIAGALAVVTIGSVSTGAFLAHKASKENRSNESRRPRTEFSQAVSAADNTQDQPIFSDDYQTQPPFIDGKQDQTRSEGLSRQEILDKIAKSPESQQGLVEGYDREGMWLSPNKPSDIAFASAKDLSKMFNNDEVDMMQYAAASQVETFADYLACLPEAIKPEELKGLNMSQIDQMLENADDASYKQLQAWFNDVMNQAYTRRQVINGQFTNAYMTLKDSSGPVNHENMELVQCTSREIGTKVTEFYWLDSEGNETGSMLVKMIPVHNINGDIVGYEGCMQAITPAGSLIYSGLPDANISHSEPNTPPEAPAPAPLENPTPEPSNAKIKSKDPGNLTTIDKQIIEDIADDTGTGQVVITPTEEVSPEDLTAQPTSTDYEGTEPTIVQNEASTEAEPVTADYQANDYSEDLGGANQDEFAPVQPNEAAQAAADAAEIPISEAPTSVSDLDSIMAEFSSSSNEVNQIINEVNNNPTEYVANGGYSIEDIMAEYMTM